ncbi:MAG: RND transporter [Verrucomicrobia bacterium]|nr:RND transporter [Verrucomicrobiota bacterium]NBU07516.1 RND transporter [Pseudomonadota bacterium]NDA65256.1 RND transporter [Verrucomicrobiota bacterium]NDD37298.1 RND transporter [Verrucomicrobiota bacterium]NDE96915.1 RND transporter [Verrucomicrobiota bacterium]
MATESPKLSLVQRLLTRMADAVYLHPRAFFYPQMVLFLVCLVFTVRHLEFNTSRNDLVGSDKKYHQNFLALLKEFPGQSDLVVVVESDRMDKNRQFVERLGAKLEAETNLFTDVFYKGDLRLMGRKALLMAKPDDLVELQKKLKDYQPFIKNFGQATNLVSLFSILNRQFRTAKQEDNAENESMVGALPALERIITEARESLERPGKPPSPGLSALFGDGPEAEREMYVTFGNGRIYLVTAHAKREELEGEAVERMRVLVAETRREVPGVSVGLTGEPVLEFDEMAQSQADSTLATVVSLVLSVLIFIYAYHSVSRPVKAAASLIVGLTYTMGYTTLVVGHLNILTITFAPMLIGLAIDFGVHLVARFEEELRRGRTDREAITLALVNTGQGVFTGAATTAAAFFAMGITNFKGIQEMGIIAGGGLLICLVPMMTLLPVLLLRGKPMAAKVTTSQTNFREQLERLWLNRPGAVLVATAALCALCGAQFGKVHFDYNLLHMQSAGLPAVVFEQRLIESGSNSILSAAVVASSLEQAVLLEQRLTNLTTVAKVESMSRFLAEDATPKLPVIRQIKEDAAAVRFARLDTQPVNVPELLQVLYSFQGFVGMAEEVTKKEGETKLVPVFRSLKEATQAWRNALVAAPEHAARQMADYQQALLMDLQDTFGALAEQQASPLRREDLPAPLRNRFIGVSGKYLLMVFPKGDVWQRETQEAFVKELRTVDPNVTGTPVQLLEYTTLLKDSYVEAAWYATAAIALMVLLHFRSLLCVLLALLPVVIGTVWMVGLMGWAGIPFNPANIMTLPLVVGIGVTNGIHILNRFAEEKNPSILGRSTGLAVLVSGLNTMAGFGSLMLGKHQGIQSLGYVMSVGTATCMIASLTFLPAVLALLLKLGWRKEKAQ